MTAEEIKRILQKKTVNIQWTINLPMRVPAHWDNEMIEFHFNDSSWCCDNLIEELKKYSETNGCICNICEAKVMSKKTWLVYLVTECEMGSEGWSGWAYYAPAEGDTDEEIYTNWVQNVKKIYDVDLSQDLKCKNGKWFCYYELAKNELPTSVYGHSEPLYIEKCFKHHMDR